MQAVPDFHVFNAGYEAGSPQLDRRAWDDLTLKSILRVLFVD